MRFFLATVLAFMVAQFVAAGSTSPSSLQLPNGYTEVQSFITFHGRVVEGGQNVTLKGTVEQIVAQIKRVNPTYFARNSTIKASDHDESKAEAGKSTLFCNLPDGAPGYIEPIEEAIQYLGALNGYCGASPGPGACGRISCSYQSAIWWCNDKTVDVSYPCYWFARNAKYVLDNCRNDNMEEVQGQSFSKDSSWNVIVGGASC